MFRFIGSFVFEYELKTLTGLHIGGSKENFDIGGLDNPVVKTYISIPDFYEDGYSLPKGVPYIPGSSLKGKLRSLLEWSLGRVEKKIEEAKNEDNKGKDDREDFLNTAGSPCSCGKCEVCVLFGTGDAKVLGNLSPEKQPGPPRLIFSDAYPTPETIKTLQRELGEGIFTEIKTENQINRITSAVSHLRRMERVPAGAVFSGRIVFNLYKDSDLNLLDVLVYGLRMLEDNFLGGCGSRGYGRVRFENIRVEFKDGDVYLGKKKPESKHFKNLAEINTEELRRLCKS